MAITATSAELQQQIDWVLALANTDPMLMKAYQAYQAGDEAGFKAAVLQSDFYKNNNKLARQRKAAKAEQPGVSASDYDSWLLGTKKRLIANGVKWDANIEKTVANGYWLGMSDDQIDASVVKAGAQTTGGTTGDTVNNLKQLANAYGVASLLDTKYWDAKSTGLFAGTLTSNDIETEIKNLSASAFPAYADGISKGISLAAQTSNIFQTYARYLEIDPNSLTFDDPRIRKIMQYTDPTTGKPAVMPQWMVEKTAKSEPDWAFTNNARDSFDSLTLKVAKDWGLV